MTEQKTSYPPAPMLPGNPLLGSALDLHRDVLGTYLRALRDGGDVVRIAAGPPGFRVVLHGVFHPDGAQRVLASNSRNYRKDSFFYTETRDVIGVGLVNSQDEDWVRQRRFCQPLFTPRYVNSYAATFTRETEVTLAAWQRASAAGPAVVDLHADMTALTLRAVTRVLFGGDANSAVDVVAYAFPLLSEYLLGRALSPVRLPRHWPTPANRRADQARQDLHRVCATLIDGRRDGAQQDLLGLLVGARDGADRLSDEEIRDQVLIFLLAGYETTAIALAFALRCLAEHPEMQQRCRAEARAVLTGDVVTAEDADRLEYITMVLKEAMRLYPPVPVLGRNSKAEDVVSGHTIPAGVDITVSPWVTHRHPEFWAVPERFDPERFSPARSAGRHRYAWFPFGGGPASCIGQHFATLEAAVMLGLILRSYEVSDPDPDVQLTIGTALRPTGPVRCRIRPVD
ncbi:cytochrome P450 [Micromonospora zingiberis]|uniref:Cytochrome P450 n=1 Tax=Micromonospora zingiberis TaxID=2053011 RepID=A0A4R0GMJ0_9ACTN|nr:cytochrome P450 [Micromonospora zingiberis]TCB97862.1 cytochrome P450 [Micromonospora zingiberis]